jgi:hypothetical protein
MPEIREFTTGQLRPRIDESITIDRFESKVDEGKRMKKRREKYASGVKGVNNVFPFWTVIIFLLQTCNEWGTTNTSCGMPAHSFRRYALRC